MSKFKVIFIEDAQKEYNKLDGSVKKLVIKALKKMQERADVLGEELTKRDNSNLIGCRKIKFRDAGIRIVYRIIGNKAEIAQILTIGKREDNEVYKDALERLMKLKHQYE